MTDSKEKMTRGDYEDLLFEDDDKNDSKKAKSSRQTKKILNKNMHLMNMITNNKNVKQRKALIETMNKRQMKGVEKYVGQFLHGRIKIPPGTLKGLKKNKKFIYQLLNKKVPIHEKQKILIQRGGAIQSLAKLGFKALLPSLLGGEEI